MSFVIIAISAVVFLFGFVVLFGAPYVPTFSKQAHVALDLLALQPGQTFIELGSGDGAVLKVAAQRGIRCIGYELNPLLVIMSKLRCWRYRQLVTIHCQNFWRITFPPCDGIYTFLLDRYMEKLDKKITQEITNPVKFVSYAFKIPGRAIEKQKEGMFLYTYHLDIEHKSKKSKL